jgi:predicted nucleic acid-binding Zn ribbon protein
VSDIDDANGAADANDAADAAEPTPVPDAPGAEPSGPDAARSALAKARAQARTRPTGASGSRFGGWSQRRRSGGSADERRSGPGPDDRDPQSLGSVVNRVAADNNWIDPLSIGTVIARWAVVVGDQVAEHTSPESLRDGELVVQADSTAWATEMKLLAATVLRRLDEELGRDVVRKVTVLGPSAPSWKKGRRSVPGRGPRDTYG